MTPPRRLRTELSDPRADSPMHEDAGLDRSVSSTERRSIAVGSSGFTAVNGDRHISLIRSEMLARPSATSSNGEQVRAAQSHSAHTSPRDQPIVLPPIATEDPERNASTNRRKRAHSTGLETTDQSSSLAAASSLSNAHPPPGNSYPVETSPETAVGVETDRRGADTVMRATYTREPSPDSTRWKKGEPLPPPRPDIEAGLAESIQREHLSLRTQARRLTGTSDQPEPQAISSARNAGPISPQEEAGGGGKRRKRNFANRTKTGCHTCRRRKKKCDEIKPRCGNCTRGGFTCAGYGPRPPDDRTRGKHAYVALRMSAPVPPPPPTYKELTPLLYSHSLHRQSEAFLPAQPLPSWPGVDPRANDGSRALPPYIGPAAPPIERPWSYSQDGWGSRDYPLRAVPDARPPGDINHGPPPTSWTSHYPPPPSPWTYPPRQTPTVTNSAYSGRESVVTSSSGNSQLALAYKDDSQLTERSKMITGQAYRQFYDDELVHDRQSCKRAVEEFNDASRASSNVSAAEKETFFRAIYQPSWRKRDPQRPAAALPGLEGSCGANTIVESPFVCDYGYNLHFGQGITVSPNCYFQDACDIYIGHNTIIGPNVRIYCVYTDLDPEIRKGNKGCYKAGPVIIEEDVFIGADSIIMPCRTIRKGAYIGVGSVVTKDVEEYTIVAGNPAKAIRRVTRGQGEVPHKNLYIEEQNNRMIKRLQTGLQHGYRDRKLKVFPK